jgi:1,4-dihydroxy-2-naphthoate octaprenyltransferase
LFPFAWVIASILLNLLPYWSALSLLALAMALGNARQTTKYSQEGMKALVGIDEKTAQLQLIFSVLMFISFIVGGIV